MTKILPIPAGFTVEELPGNISVSFRWYKHVAWFLLFFCLFWDGFLVVWFALPSPLFFKVFALLHVVVGVGITWYTLCLFLNRTTISISGSEFSIAHTPLFFPGFSNRVVSRSEFNQLYIKQKITSNRGSVTTSYNLNILTPDNRSQKLPLSFDQYEQAIFIKRKVEQLMRITPQEIEGEHQP